MTQILLYHKAYDRIAASLQERFGGTIEPVLWDKDGSLNYQGKAVQASDVKPLVAWFSGDVLFGSDLAAIANTVTQLPSIRWIQSANAGLDHPAYADLVARGIQFSKSSAQSIPIAEYVLAYALEHVQNLDLRRKAQQEGRWQAHRFNELWHSTWLIIGYGHIGRNVAKRAKAFDGHTLIVRQSQTDDEYTDEVMTLAEMPNHISRADFVVLACPATEATKGLVNSQFLAQLKENALLINIARGSLIDEQALLTSLEQGRPARAVLDVFAKEPLPAESPLWQHPRVTITAHTSNAGSGTRPRGDELFLSNLQRFLAGEEPTDIVRFS